MDTNIKEFETIVTRPAIEEGETITDERKVIEVFDRLWTCVGRETGRHSSSNHTAKELPAVGGARSNWVGQRTVVLRAHAQNIPCGGCDGPHTYKSDQVCFARVGDHIFMVIVHDPEQAEYGLRHKGVETYLISDQFPPSRVEALEGEVKLPDLDREVFQAERRAVGKVTRALSK